MQLNKRISKRVPFRVPVKFRRDGEFLSTGLGIDVSATGLCIKTTTVFPPGTVLKIEIPYNNQTFHAVGVVMWAKKVPPNLIYTVKAGMGIRFNKIDSHLEALILEKTER